MIPENQRLIRIREGGDQMTCIICPIGCRLAVSRDGDELTVEGNRCRRGRDYAEEEFRDPRRVVTGTCAVAGSLWLRVPVKSSASVPVDRIPGFLNAMYDLRLTAPIEPGSVVLQDVDGTGISLVSTARAVQEDADEIE